MVPEINLVAHNQNVLTTVKGRVFSWALNEHGC